MGIRAGGLFTGAEGVETDASVALHGGSAAERCDPCYHLAYGTFDNGSLKGLDVNSDAVAYAALRRAMSTELVNGGVHKGPSWLPGSQRQVRSQSVTGDRDRQTGVAMDEGREGPLRLVLDRDAVEA